LKEALVNLREPRRIPVTADEMPHRAFMSIDGRAARIAQAQGRVSVQAGCTVEEALDLMVERAKFDNLTLEEIATGVAEHRILFG
jgi:hypothetical protein